MHNKWLQASGSKKIDVYHATVDDFVRAALQSLFYFNYLRGGPTGTGPSKTELELCLTARAGNSRRMMKLLDHVAVEAGLNTRVPHLEGRQYLVLQSVSWTYHLETIVILIVTIKLTIRYPTWVRESLLLMSVE